MTAYELAILFLAAVAAGAVNAVAGGGTLVSFPVLLALGVAPISANVTNAIALCPGYLGATWAQWPAVQDQRRHLRICLPAGLLGGVAGAAILLHTQERVFQQLVPYMLLIGSLLLASQGMTGRFAARQVGREHRNRPYWAAFAVLGAAVYGGFFSAGMSVVILAVLAATLDDSLTRLNALKQITAFAVNAAAVVLFLFSEHVLWSAVAIMALGALAGGHIGGRVAGYLSPAALRWTVVSAGLTLALHYGMKQ